MALLNPGPVLRPGRRWRAACCLALGLAFGAGPALPAPPSREYQVKAVFLFNFAQFVDWPPAAFPSAGSPLVIGVLGEDPFGAALDDAVRGETVASRPLAVRRFRRPADIAECHILFVSRPASARLGEVLAALDGRAVLTVGEADDFAARGGMIHFVTDKSRTRLRINLDAARNAGLTLSSKLLRPAEIVATARNAP
ncbi:MAG: YfiR family protein [Opitutaceae bacterium]|nr:YfiR family protein [Opitutaceae bacterium]